jgi:hypothetical protein
MSDLVAPLDGSPVPGVDGELTLDRYVSQFASVPAQERAELSKAGYVSGWLRSTLDEQFGRRVYLLQFRDVQAAHDVYAWYHGFATTGTFQANLNREHFGRVASFQTPDKRQAYYAQVMFAAGPFVAVASVTISATGNIGNARSEVGKIAAAESSRLPG